MVFFKWQVGTQRFSPYFVFLEMQFWKAEEPSAELIKSIKLIFILCQISFVSFNFVFHFLGKHTHSAT